MIRFTIATIFFGPTLAGFIVFDEQQSFHLRGSNQREVLSSRKVKINFNDFSRNSFIEFPHQLILQRTEPKIRNRNFIRVLRNESELAEGVFFYDGNEENGVISGSITWGKAGRYFRLETYCDSENYYLWKEIDPNYWSSLENRDRDLRVPEDVVMFVEPRKNNFRELGVRDGTTIATISITFYTTVEFRNSFNNSLSAISAFIEAAIAETNVGYANSNISIQLVPHCIIHSDVRELENLRDMLKNFLVSTRYDFTKLRYDADMAVMLTDAGDACGLSYINTVGLGITIGVVQRSCILGYYSLGHEIAHMFGAAHNRETGATNSIFPYAFGFLMKPPRNSGARTILSFYMEGYETRLNYYSNPNIFVGGVPTGSSNADNAELLSFRRFEMSAVGNERLSCPKYTDPYS